MATPERRCVVCSFWVHRPKDFPQAAPYLEMLRIVDGSCRRAGFEHVVLTDFDTMPRVIGAGLMTYAMGLPRNLMRAVTEAQARWLEAASSEGVDTIMVGADCIVRRDFRDELPAGDVAIAFMKGHKRWRLNNGFIYVPAEARERVAPLLRRVADGCGEVMCDDMVALERALLPMPDDYGVHERQGLQVNFVPLDKWNRYMRSVEDEASEAAVLHFMGDAFKGKPLFFAWANRHGFAC